MKVLKLGFLLTISIYLFTSCNQSNTSEKVQEGKEEALDSAMIRSQVTYENYCSSCHGEQMIAFVDRQWKHGKTRDSLILSITNGYADAGMPNWGAAFSADQISELADYILTGIAQVEMYGFEKEVLTSDTFNTENFTITFDTIVAGMEVPWGMTFLPSGDLLVTERSGILYRIDAEGKKVIVKGTPRVRRKEQGGLLDVVLHPDFESNGWIYLSYSDYIVEKGDTLGGTAVNRYVLANDQLTESLEIFKGKPYSKRNVHFGSRLAFDNQGHLLITAGDRGNRDVGPQNLANPQGKIHRVNDDGSIPSDNPFLGQSEAFPSVYSYGHRNAQGLAVNKLTGDVWVNEHGPRGGDELNLIKKGLNYGWPVISYGINYDGTTFTNMLEKEGMEQPKHYWVPSIAPSGLLFVTSDLYPGWKGNTLMGSMRYQYLNRCIMDGEKVTHEEALLKKIGRVRNVIEGPDGYIYVSVEQPGYVFRLMPIQ